MTETRRSASSIRRSSLPGPESVAGRRTRRSCGAASAGPEGIAALEIVGFLAVEQTHGRAPNVESCKVEGPPGGHDHNSTTFNPGLSTSHKTKKETSAAMPSGGNML